MLTFLKKLGQILANADGIAAGIGPFIKPFLGSGEAAKYVGTAVNDLTQIAGVVTTVEAIIQTPGSGATKLAAAVPLVQQIITSSELVAGKKVANNDLFVKACQEFTQATVDLLNSIHPDEAKHAA